MHAEAFTWYVAGPGVEINPLGSFHDHPGSHADLRIATVRLTGHSAYDLAADHAQIAWSARDGRPYAALTCLNGVERIFAGQARFDPLTSQRQFALLCLQ
ncbi:hypothetical protein [Streptomyces sp. NPDC059894]|uniref:hypothetical protein n=1 Tax=unclassified Streptomyces TaxID=2593676 RepID=UPI0036555FC9